MIIKILHQEKIIHSDIKPENIIFCNKIIKQQDIYNSNIKIIDFDLSCTCDNKKLINGTIGYSPNEFINNYYKDIFSR